MTTLQSVQRLAKTLALPFTTIGTAYGKAAAKRPFVVGVVTTGIKTSAADLFAQKVMEGREWDNIDWTRHTAFCIFGFTYLGGFQYFFYTKVLKWVTHPVTVRMGHIASAPIKTLIDQTIHHPFMYFPTFYALKYSLVQGEPTEVAMERYWDELYPNCQALWMIWVPAQLVNFSIVPSHLQIPFAAGVSFVWTVILSMMRGSDTGQAVELQSAEEGLALVEGAAAGGQPVAEGEQSAGGEKAATGTPGSGKLPQAAALVAEEGGGAAVRAGAQADEAVPRRDSGLHTGQGAVGPAEQGRGVEGMLVPGGGLAEGHGGAAVAAASVVEPLLMTAHLSWEPGARLRRALVSAAEFEFRKGSDCPVECAGCGAGGQARGAASLVNLSGLLHLAHPLGPSAQAVTE